MSADPRLGRARGRPAGRPEPGMQKAARTAAALAIGELAGKVATLALVMYAVRELSPEDFGAFNYALAYGALLAVLPTWGLDPLLIQQVGGDTSRLPRQYAHLLLLRTAVAVPVVVIGSAVGMLGRPTPEARVALAALLVAAVLESYSHAPRAVAGVLRTQASTAVVLALQRLLTAALGALALVLGLGLVGLSLTYLAATFAGSAGLFQLVRRAGIRPAWRETGVRALARTAWRSVPLGVDALVAMALFRVDTLMLGWIHGDTVVAEYSPPKRLVETVLFVTWAISRVTYPAMASARADTERARRALRAGVAATAFCFVPFAVMMIVLGEDILALLFGDFYATRGTLSLQVLSATPLFFAIGYLYSHAFVAKGQSMVALSTSVVAATVNVVANVLLIPPLGAVGAAVATSGSYLLEAVLLVTLAVRRSGRLRAPASLLLPLVCSLPAAAAAHFLPVDSILAMLVFGVVYLATWLPAAYRWQPDDLAVVRSLLTRGRGVR